MSCLITGLFYEHERGEAEAAAQVLRAKGLPAESLSWETRSASLSEAGRKGGQTGSTERERRRTALGNDLEAGAIFGLLTGLAIGFTIGMLRDAYFPHWPMTSPLLTGPIGALLGLIAAGLIGWRIEFTRDRAGAEPSPPRTEIVLRVRVEESQLNQVKAALLGAHAHQVKVNVA